MAVRLTELLRERIWEPLRLERAEAQARRYSPERLERVRAFTSAARLRFQAGRELRDAPGRLVALSLYREALLLALAGKAAAAGDYELSVAPPLERALEWLDAAAAADPDLTQAKELLSASDVLAFDRMSESERRTLGWAAERAIPRLLASYEHRTVSELRVLRVVRATSVVAGAIALLFGAVTLASLASSDADTDTDSSAHAKPVRPRRK